MRNLADITAVILAGGLGTRLRPAVADRPKVLAEVGGRPFFGYLLDQLLRARIKKVVLSTGYLGEQIQQTFGTSYGPMDLVYSQEHFPLGTAGALRAALSHLESDPVLVMNGDSYCDVQLENLFRFHEERGAGSAILLAKVRDTERYGQVRLDSDNRILEFVEKGKTGGPGWVNSGIYVIRRSLLMTIPEKGAVSLEREMLPSWTGQPLYAYYCQGSFLDIGTPEDYARADQFFYSLPVRTENEAGGIVLEDPEISSSHRRVCAHLQASAEVKQRVAESCSEAIVKAARVMAETVRSGGKVLLCGNGGSAADCQHMAAEFVSRLSKEFDHKGMSAIALTTDTSFLTAYSNDCGFEGVFQRQVEVLGKPGDTLLGISTSGHSPNVIRAVKAAKTGGMHTVVLTGEGGVLAQMAEIPIPVPHRNTQFVQEAHLAIEHILCSLVEVSLFRKEDP